MHIESVTQVKQAVSSLILEGIYIYLDIQNLRYFIYKNINKMSNIFIYVRHLLVYIINLFLIPTWYIF